jgi:hypothetical protein
MIYPAESMLAEWRAEFDRQNEMLEESDEEPVTVAEFMQCKFDDAKAWRAGREAKRVERWWETYNAALTGNTSRDMNNDNDDHRWSKEAADLAHGKLEP